jgi:uncharacterized RmlC-like cupin family protein
VVPRGGPEARLPPRGTRFKELGDCATMTRHQPVRIIQPALFDRGTAQTPGSERRSTIAVEVGIKTALSAGISIVEPGARTGIHHHGEQETIAYVLEGDCCVRWGERGEFSARACSGDFIHVPAWLPHMEINQSTDTRCAWAVVRSTAKPIVINLPDDSWGLETAARAT